MNMEELKIGQEAVIQNKETMLANLERELSDFTKTLNQSAQIQDWVKTEARIIEENDKVLQDKFVPLNPNFEFEKDETYIANMRELNHINNGRRLLQLSQQIDAIDKNIVSIKEQMKGTEQSIEKLSLEIKHLRGE